MNRFSILLTGIIFIFIFTSISVSAQERPEEPPRGTYVDSVSVNTGTNEGPVDILEYADPDHEGPEPNPTPAPEGALVMLIWHLVWLI